jgi:hypothetical protein
MKNSILILLLSVLILTGCGSSVMDNSQIYIGAEAGPIDVSVAVDNNGEISVSGGIAPKFKVGLGPIELKVGVQKTLELTKEKPYTLFVIWEDNSGEVQREEYEIGKSFHVRFTQNELIQEIQGDNNSVIVAVKRSRAELPTPEPKVIVVVVTPTLRPVLPTQKQPTSTPSHSSQLDPEQFIRDYFRLLKNQEYDTTWSMLSSKFQSNHTFGEYKSFWNTVNSVEILLVDVKSESDSQVFVYVEAHYYYKSGVVTTAHTTYKLVKSGSSWLFDPN